MRPLNNYTTTLLNYMYMCLRHHNVLAHDIARHAGVYTAEEVAMITRDKMIRLQSLYIDQFKRLQHLLKEKRRKYLHSVRNDRETYGEAGDKRLCAKA